MEKEKMRVKSTSKERIAIATKKTPMKIGWYSLFELRLFINTFLVLFVSCFNGKSGLLLLYANTNLSKLSSFCKKISIAIYDDHKPALSLQSNEERN